MKVGTYQDAVEMTGRTYAWVKNKVCEGVIKIVGYQEPEAGKRVRKKLIDLDTVPMPGSNILFKDMIDDFPALNLTRKAPTIDDLNESLKVAFKDPCVNDALHSKLHSDWAGLQEKNMGGK